jgi:hypothetical protein
MLPEMIRFLKAKYGPAPPEPEKLPEVNLNEVRKKYCNHFPTLVMRNEHESRVVCACCAEELYAKGWNLLKNLNYESIFTPKNLYCQGAGI